jgi:hypothetical protein
MFILHKTEFIMLKHLLIIRGTSVGIVTGYAMEDREGSEFESRWGQAFSISISSIPAMGAYPVGTRGSFLGG